MSLVKFLNNWLLKNNTKDNNYLLVTVEYPDDRFTPPIIKQITYKLKKIKNTKKDVEIYLDNKFEGKFVSVSSFKENFGPIIKIEAYQDFPTKLLESSENEIVKKESKFQFPLHSTETTLDRPKIAIASLQPNEEWNKVMEKFNRSKQNAQDRLKLRTNLALSLIRRRIQEYTSRPWYANIDLTPQELTTGREVINNFYNRELDGIDTTFRSEEMIDKMVKTIQDLPQPQPGNFDITGDCSICLTEMEKNETICKLGCGHVFHCDCINRWIREPLSNYGYQIKSTCPYCRQAVQSIITNVKGSNFGKKRSVFENELNYLEKLNKC